MGTRKIVVTASQIRAVAAENDLCMNGYRTREYWDDGFVNPTVSTVERVQRVVDWLLRNFPPSTCTKRITPNAPGSYKLKHCAEYSMDWYVSNGELLVAAYLSGFVVVPDGLRSPNGRVNINARHYRAVRERAEAARLR